jgi:hypothetical protein
MSIDDVRKKAKQLSEKLGRIAKIKGGHLKDAEQLELALHQLPPADAYEAATEEIREQAQAWIAEVRRDQVRSFNSHLSEYLQKVRDGGEQMRETAKGWRVGLLELEVSPESGRARALYSREEVVGWRDVRLAGDFERLARDARQKLAKAEINERTLPDVMWQAYDARRPSGGRSSRVKLTDFFEELRVVLVRGEVKGSPHKKLRFAEFPRWAALYNMDRYLAIASSVSEEKRLVPETGSQADIQRGLGWLLNGLDPAGHTMNYCYIHSHR